MESNVLVTFLGLKHGIFVVSYFVKTLTKKLFWTSDFSLSVLVLVPSGLVISFMPLLVFSLLLAYLKKALGFFGNCHSKSVTAFLASHFTCFHNFAYRCLPLSSLVCLYFLNAAAFNFTLKWFPLCWNAMLCLLHHMYSKKCCMHTSSYQLLMQCLIFFGYRPVVIWRLDLLAYIFVYACKY